MYPDFFDTQFNPLRKNTPYPPKTGIVTQDDINETEELDSMLKQRKIKPNVLANKIANSLNLGEPTLFGSGTAGYAYGIPGGKVMKITPDFSEYSNAKKILGKKTKHLADVYGTYRLTGPMEGIYVIITEYLQNDSDRFEDMEYQLNNIINKLRDTKNWTMLPRNAGMLFDGVLFGKYGDSFVKEVRAELTNNINNDSYSAHKFTEDALWYFDQMIEMMNEMRANGITSRDFGFSNIGLKKSGDIGFYDLGYAKEEMAYKGQEDEYGIEVKQENKKGKK